MNYNLHSNCFLSFLLSWIIVLNTVSLNHNNNQKFVPNQNIKQGELFKWSTRKIIQINNGSVPVRKMPFL